MQSNVHSIETLVELQHGLGELGEGFDAVAQDIRATLHAAEAWLSSEMPAYWKRQTRLAEQQLASAQDRLMQAESTTNAHDRPPATVEKKNVRLARKRLELCQSRWQAIRRHAIEVERAVQRLAGPLAEIDESVAAGIPAARAELARLIEALQSYIQPMRDQPGDA